MTNKLLELLSKITTSSREVSPDILILQFTIVNAFIVGNAYNWVLVDTGLENSYDFIVKSAKLRFEKEVPPKAIILTHGHFDHIGSVAKLSEHWDVPVYAHELEIPYITGKKDYPTGDSSVDEGLVAKMSPSFPHRSIHLGLRAVSLPSDGTVPGMTEWKWIHTPGHTEGHISLFREKDRAFIIGDAFTTTKQESFMSVLTQNEQIKGPPAYLTTDWETAKNSVEKIKELNPETIIPSHGKPMQGDEIKKHLEMLTNNFNEIAVPRQGRYIDRQ
ncbi:MAG: Zn-dependent hydrolase, glyoxylase [Clostridia bacterium]|nr:Zn-dependent hydrolase, glyoxylase [Clostridia bacterium]